MFPIILKLGPITIRTYGLLVSIGLFVSLKYIIHNAKKSGIDEDSIFDLVLYSVVAGLVGARLTYVLFNMPFYWQHPADIFKVWEGGLVYYGGLVFGSAAALVFVRFHAGIKLLSLADIIAPALVLGHFFGRLGCFFAGCCYGRQAELPWAVRFSNPHALAPLNVSLHPVQLYEAVGNLIIFFVLHYYNKRKHLTGYTFAFYLIFYGIMRFMLEFVRGDERGGFLLGFSPGQIISFIAVIAGIYILDFVKKHDTTSNR